MSGRPSAAWLRGYQNGARDAQEGRRVLASWSWTNRADGPEERAGYQQAQLDHERKEKGSCDARS